jgi:hypothetical protein
MEVSLMKNRTIVLSCAFVLGLAVLCSAADPAVVQPDSLDLTPGERNLLLTGIANLESLLSDQTLGPQLAHGSSGWTSREFARFSAWSLADRGYSVYLATSASWQGGPHTWVLVGLSLGTKTAWIPVEATPLAGGIQTTLGQVPLWSRSSGSIHYDERYVAFTSVNALPDNRAPIAQIRTSGQSVEIGELVTLSANQSYDPDGQLTVFVWCVDGRPCFATSSWSHIFRATARGEKTVRLIVIDNLGRPGTAQVTLIASSKPLGEDRNSGGCGCGK